MLIWPLASICVYCNYHSFILNESWTHLSQNSLTGSQTTSHGVDCRLWKYHISIGTKKQKNNKKTNTHWCISTCWQIWYFPFDLSYVDFVCCPLWICNSCYVMAWQTCRGSDLHFFSRTLFQKWNRPSLVRDSFVSLILCCLRQRGVYFTKFQPMIDRYVQILSFLFIIFVKQSLSQKCHVTHCFSSFVSNNIELYVNRWGTIRNKIQSWNHYYCCIHFIKIT